MKTKVAIVRCRTYDPEELQRSVRTVFELLGGVHSFVKKGEKVLVKPNMLSGRPPEDGANTHIELIRAVVRTIKECDAYPVVGDNPGGSLAPGEMYQSSGLASMANEEGIELAETKNVKLIQGMPVSSYFFECDKIISLPKMKTHNLMVLTGAVKNMYGSVSGLTKTQMHKRFLMPEEFCNILVDVFNAVRPQLVLMDGVVAMDGDGPSAGTLKNVGLLIGSRDSVAIDTVFSHLIGIHPLDILTTREAYKRGLGEADMNNIEIVGRGLEESSIRGFRLPRSTVLMKMPGRFVRALANLVRFGPYINADICKKCKICSRTCPVSAITIDEERSVIDRHKCIQCMCCHEVCPDRAVELKRNFLARAVGL